MMRKDIIETLDKADAQIREDLKQAEPLWVKEGLMETREHVQRAISILISMR